MSQQLNYLFYATLLDGYQNYLSSSEIYQKYWGFADEPEFSEEEFEQKQFLSLIDRINRVPFDSEPADSGTAFNEIVDCIILKRKSTKMEVESIKQDSAIVAFKAILNEREFIFPAALCFEFANYYKGAVPQVRTEAVLPTKYGNVLLYGYIDELMPLAVCDLKTTKNYTVGDFKNHWQHIVYPYCLNQNGNSVFDFEYNIAAINRLKSGAVNYTTHTEYYAFNPITDTQRLTAHVEGLIEFIEANKDLITDKKIFNYELQ
jgi:hypothetical protein